MHSNSPFLLTAKIQLPALSFLSVLPHSFLPSPFVKRGEGPKLHRKRLWGNFFFFIEILVGGTKRWDSIFCGSTVGGTCQVWSIFPQSVAKITFPEHTFSYSCCHILLQLHVMIDHQLIHILYIFLASFDQCNILSLRSYFYYSYFYFTIYVVTIWRNVSIPLKSKLVKC